MKSPLVKDLLEKNKLISNQVNRQELEVSLSECHKALKNTDGAVVEFGCYSGTTSLFLARLLKQAAPEREFHVYDSFAGLPPKDFKDISPLGEQFKSGGLKTSKLTLVKNFKQAGLPLPKIHKFWFSELSSNDVPGKIAFAFLDGDYYQSIKDSLKLVWPRLNSGAVVVVDDYQNEALPGTKIAVDEWLGSHQANIRAEASLAVLRR